MYKSPSHISTKVYSYLNNGHICYRAYISNERTHEFLVLEDISAQLWDFIVQGKEQDEINSFAKNNDILGELDLFFAELEKAQCLVPKNTQEHQNNYKAIVYNSEINDNSEQFVREMYSFIAEKNYLPNLFLELTYNCNLKCIHCFNDKTIPSKEIPFKKIKKVIDEAHELGVFNITLSGGECTINKDFIKIAKYIRSKHIQLEIFTNGQTLYENEEFYQEFLSLYPYYVGISLYSMNSETHDLITGVKGSFEKTISVIKRLRSDNVNVQIKSFQTKYNMSDYKDVIDFANSIGAGIKLDTMLVLNKDKTNCDCLCTKEQCIKLYSSKETNLYKTVDKTVQINSDLWDKKLCGAGTKILSVNPEMKLLPCVSFNYELGDLNSESLKSIYFNKNKNSPLNIIRKLSFKDLKECFKEPYCAYCGYCLGVAYQESGLLKKSEIMCYHANIKYYLDNKVI